VQIICKNCLIFFFTFKGGVDRLLLNLISLLHFSVIEIAFQKRKIRGPFIYKNMPINVIDLIKENAMKMALNSYAFALLTKNGQKTTLNLGLF